MKKLLVGSFAALGLAALLVAGVTLLGPDGAVAQETDSSDIETRHHFSPLDEVLDELVGEDVIDSEQAEAIRQRMTEKMPTTGERFHFRMEGFPDDLPEGFRPPPGPPGTEEFNAWLEEMQELVGDDFFGGRMFQFEGDPSDDGSFPFPFPGHGPMGPGMMGEGFHHFDGDFNVENLEEMIDEMTERFGGELPSHLQEMLDQLQEQFPEIIGAETSVDA